jgi:hypothetical protein
VVSDGAGYAATSAPVNTVSAGSGHPALRARGPGVLQHALCRSGSLPQRLSQTGVFSDTQTLAPVSALVPYTVNVPLWSDAAVKTRWLAVPNDGAPYGINEQIAFTPAGEWSFPAGTVFIKHFELATDETSPDIRRRLEARLLVRDTNGAV